MENKDFFYFFGQVGQVRTSKKNSTCPLKT